MAIATGINPKTEFRPLLASAFYEVKAYSPYIVSLVHSINALNMMGVQWDYIVEEGHSWVDRAKNELVHRFLQTDFTHILIIDSDLSWNVEGFVRIMKAAMMGAEVVGGAYPNKNNWTSFGGTPIMQHGKPVSREVGGLKLYEMWGIPGGFIMYSRKAFERTRPLLNSYYDQVLEEQLVEYFSILVNKEDSKEPNFIKRMQGIFNQAVVDFGSMHGTRMNEMFLECFRCNVEKNGQRLGEDIYFQQRYREAGGTIWCEPNIDFIHLGVKDWRGNYMQHIEGRTSSPIPKFLEASPHLKGRLVELEDELDLQGLRNPPEYPVLNQPEKEGVNETDRPE